MEFLQLNGDLDRRVFIQRLGSVSLGLLAMTTFGGCESCTDTIQSRPTRRRLRTGSAEVDADIATYAQAVQLMQALPASDPRSWAAQAAIHGTAGVGFNFCQHGTDHFFSWHRAYLVFFEQICQELTGNQNFGLPYWNWNQNGDIHSAYLAPASSLFRTRTRTSMAGHSAVATATLSPMFTDTNFFTFGQQIEGAPHNTVHGVIGAEMGGAGSALDPIFWNHHCMVDYCWAKWNLELENDNPNDSGWSDTAWNHFVDRAGNPAETSAGLTTIMPLLSYQYESSAIGDSPAALIAQTKADFQRLERRLRAGADIRLEIKRRVPIADRAAVSMARSFSRDTTVLAREFSTLLDSGTATETVFASIEYAQLPPVSDFFVRVFINLPTADSTTSTEDPHYAGSFAFFGTHIEGHAGHQHQPRFLVNLVPTLRRLRGLQALTEENPISVQLVAVSMLNQFENPEAELTLEKLELIVTPVIVRSR